MISRSYKLRYFFQLLLAASLLLLSWFQIHHELTAHIDHQDGSCAICVFTGHLGDGVTPAPIMPGKAAAPFHYHVVSHYVAPALDLLFRFTLSERGPPFLFPA